MKKILATLFMSVAAAGSALAADLPQAPPPVRAPAAYVPVAPPVYNWGGVYVGINGGWGFGSTKWTVGPAGALASTSGSPSDNGGVVGGTLGVNFQTGAFVFGAEGDWDYSGVSTGTTTNVCNVTGTCQTGNNWLATFRGRAGYAADRVLFYGTAGGAFANMQTTINGASTTKSQAGWTAGVGVEVAFTDNITGKIEYLYTDLGTFNGNCTSAACLAVTGGPALPVSIKETQSLIRVGVNYKFNF